MMRTAHFFRGFTPSHVPTGNSGPMRLLGYDLDLVKLELNSGLSAEHGHDDADCVLIDLDAFHHAVEGT